MQGLFLLFNCELFSFSPPYACPSHNSCQPCLPLSQDCRDIVELLADGFVMGRFAEVTPACMLHQQTTAAAILLEA